MVVVETPRLVLLQQTAGHRAAGLAAGRRGDRTGLSQQIQRALLARVLGFILPALEAGAGATQATGPLSRLAYRRAQHAARADLECAARLDHRPPRRRQ